MSEVRLYIVTGMFCHPGSSNEILTSVVTARSQQEALGYFAELGARSWPAHSMDPGTRAMDQTDNIRDVLAKMDDHNAALRHGETSRAGE